MNKKTVAELWEEIFFDLNIINNINSEGYFKITADDIRKYKEINKKNKQNTLFYL